MADELLAKVCSRKVGSVVETILTESQLSYDDLDRLEELLKEKRKTAVESVPCNCIPGQMLVTRRLAQPSNERLRLKE